MNLIDMTLPATPSHELTLLMASDAYLNQAHPGHLETKEVVRRHFDALYPSAPGTGHAHVISAFVFDGAPSK